MRFWVLSLVTVVLLSVGLEESSVTGIPFSGVTPNLSTGWFHKSGPTESLVFGLIVLKVLALRMAGVIPYNMNQLLDEGSFLDNQLKSWRRRKSSSRTQRDLRSLMENSEDEMQIVDRVLLGLRRIDSHDCFLKHLCNVNQRKLAAKSSVSDDQILQIFSMKRKRKSGGVVSLFREALHPEPVDCDAKFSLCPLGPKDFTLPSILNGIF